MSLRDALLRADEFDGLSVDFPTQAPAILRQVLLPVLLHALDAPRKDAAWSALFNAGRLIGEDRDRVAAYLDRWRPRFDLFDEERPFAQVAGLKTAKGDTKPAVSLITTAATGNTVPLHWTYTEDDDPPLTAAEAARWLVTVQCWDTAGIKTGAVGDPKARKGKTMGNPIGPLGQLGVVVPTGASLYQTLILNLPIWPDGLKPDDRPQWAADEPQTAVWSDRVAPTGLLNLLTWQSRRIRLFPCVDGDEVVVPRVIIAAGDRMPQTPHDIEPHTAWHMSTDGKKTVAAGWRPRTHRPGRAGWRGLDSLLALERQDGTRFETSRLLDQLSRMVVKKCPPFEYPLRVEQVGVTYGTQNAVVEQVISDSIPMPVAALRTHDQCWDAVAGVYEQAEKLAQAANRLSDDVRRACGGDPVPWDKGQRLGELVLHALDPLVRRFLRGACHTMDLDTLDKAQRAWEMLAHDVVLDTIKPMLAATPASAIVGRTDEATGRVHRLSTAENGFRDKIRKILNLDIVDQADQTVDDGEESQ